MLRFHSMSLAVVGLALTLAVGCAQSPTAPASVPVQPPPVARTGPLSVALVGQSNAGLGRNAFAQNPDITLVPTRPGANAAAIQYWAPELETWAALEEDLRGKTLDAFVFWQGEGDVENPQYGAALADFVPRVRAVTGQPNLVIVLMQYGRAYSGRVGGSEDASIAFAKSDPHAIYVPTHDLEWLPDNGHMTEAGYDAVARRIVTMVKAKTGR